MFKLIKLLVLALLITSCATNKQPKVTGDAPATIKVDGAIEYCKNNPESPLCQKKK